ncbi:hypothetical protein D3C71_1505450 [compost metagenome]
MLDQQAGPSLLVVLTGRGLQPPVDADDPLEASAAAGQLQHGGAAEAVAHRHRIVEPAALPARLGEPCLQQFAHLGSVLIKRPGELLPLFHGGRSDPCPEQVHREHAVTERHQHLGPLHLVIRQPVPVVNQHHQGRLLVGGSQVISFEGLTVNLVAHSTGLGRAPPDKPKQGQDPSRLHVRLLDCEQRH